MMNTIRRPDMDKTTASKSLKNRPTTLKLEYPTISLRQHEAGKMKKPAYHGGLLLEKAHRPHRTQGQAFSGPQERAFSAEKL